MDIIPASYDNSLSTIVITRPEHMDLDSSIRGWMKEKIEHSQSQETEEAYERNMQDFRFFLKKSGLDLDSPSGLVAPFIQQWAGASKQSDKNGVAPATFNQRKAILSSFYRYAIRMSVLKENPTEKVKRRSIHKVNAARPIKQEAISKGLEAIPGTQEGQRDYALLSVALQTGRRVSELANLRMGDLRREGATISITWKRCKGNKQMGDTLEEETAAALYDYLESVYGSQIDNLPAETPVWVSFSNVNKGQAVSTKTLQRVCERYLGTSKFHATRHTWAKTMQNNGARLDVISKGLGHENQATTSLYLEDLEEEYKNPLAGSLVKSFGIKKRKRGA